MELKAGTHRKSKWVIRHYREICGTVKSIEKRRPRLLRRVLKDEATGEVMPLERQRLPRVLSDQKVITTYVEGCLSKEIVDAVLAERMRKSDADIMTDVCVKGMSVPEAAEHNRVSELTVKRARLRMETEYDAEVALRDELEDPVKG